MYLGRQPQICSPCGSGGVSSISITHVETFHSLMLAKSWNRLWQTMKAGKMEPRRYWQNQMINSEGRLKSFIWIFHKLSFISSGCLSLFLSGVLSLFFQIHLWEIRWI